MIYVNDHIEFDVSYLFCVMSNRRKVKEIQRFVFVIFFKGSDIFYQMKQCLTLPNKGDILFAKLLSYCLVRSSICL